MCVCVCGYIPGCLFIRKHSESFLINSIHLACALLCFAFTCLLYFSSPFPIVLFPFFFSLLPIEIRPAVKVQELQEHKLKFSLFKKSNICPPHTAHPNVGWAVWLDINVDGVVSVVFGVSGHFHGVTVVVVGR